MPLSAAFSQVLAQCWGTADRSSVQTPRLGEDGARGGGGRRATVAVYKLLGLVRMVHGGGGGVTVAVYKLLGLVRMVHGGRATVAVYKLLTLVRMVRGGGGRP